MEATQVADGLFCLSANLGTGLLFEGMWPLPRGCSMNSYVVKGREVAIVDGVCDWDGVPETLYAQMAQIGVDVHSIRYVVINHTEPDHTGWLKSFLQITRDFEVVITQKGLELARAFYDLEVNYRIVRSGDTIDLGNGKMLRFEETPNVHWPDTMVTLETGTGTLLSCDIFGAFGALEQSPFDDRLDEAELKCFEAEALRYFANIVCRFSPSVARAVEKVKGLPVRIVAPGHGPIWRRDPGRIIDLYQRLASFGGGPAEPVVTVVWGTMYGNTERALAPVLEGIAAEGVETAVHQVPETQVSNILASAWRSTGIVLAMPTYEFRMFPPMAAALEELGRKVVKGKVAFRLGSFGWSGGAQRELDEIVERHKLGWNFLEPVEFKGAALPEQLELLYERGRELARRVKSAALRQQ
ncbi:FprA family A-type flavoprotein [Geomesophilobacter sediminis]|uniref:FprA family A-type flavoprotein n=1 Tax=Geomesophilobacter sediminis TaxID=2798584 RepID=A0A8J7M200_9BACT|nr:FprA family A-type flavoprotein [Geomesophilobacter sediminis]MBJ6727238.1 FprA family A-type flavoprotein [Geomesophilobacter sediminis]